MKYKMTPSGPWLWAIEEEVRDNKRCAPRWQFKTELFGPRWLVQCLLRRLLRQMAKYPGEPEVFETPSTPPTPPASKPEPPVEYKQPPRPDADALLHMWVSASQAEKRAFLGKIGVSGERPPRNIFNAADGPVYGSDIRFPKAGENPIYTESGPAVFDPSKLQWVPFDPDSK